NQGESDIDCGGATACPRCVDFKTCTAITDCQTNMCTTGVCGAVGCKTFGTTPGYLGCERTVPVASLPCEDIRLTGTRTGLGDDSSISVALPFTLNFFGIPRPSA